MTITTQNMMASVRWLDTASHTVRLERGSIDEGITNGNIANPAVKITPAIARLLDANASHGRFENAITPRAPAKAAIGASVIHGRAAKFASQAPDADSTVFATGANALDAAGIAVIRNP